MADFATNIVGNRKVRWRQIAGSNNAGQTVKGTAIDINTVASRATGGDAAVAERSIRKAGVTAGRVSSNVATLTAQATHGHVASRGCNYRMCCGRAGI